MALNAGLAGFVCDAFLYAERRSAPLALRLLWSPFGGVDRDDAGTLAVAARERETLAEVIAARRLPLSREGYAAATQFATALERTAAACRTQGADAREMLRAVRAAFALNGDSDAAERHTLDVLAEQADDFDRTRSGGGDAWNPGAFIERVERALQRRGGAGESASSAAPLGPHPRESATPVRSRGGHFSPSSLGAYSECRRKWYYRYICGAVEDRGSPASFYGSAFHYALEQFHREFPRADSAPPAELAMRLDASVVDAFERYRRGFGTQVEFELQKRRARRTARRYLEWFRERFRKRPFEVVGAETECDVEFDEQHFVGYIDRLDRDDATGNVTVVDYKTGNIAQSAAEYRERIERYVDFQLPFYYWARTKAGDRVCGLALVPLKDALLDVRPIELEVVPVSAPPSRPYETTGLIGIDELERARRKMVELARHLSADPIDAFPVTEDPEACAFCVYRPACRARPRRQEDRFGR